MDWAHFGHVLVGHARRALSCFVMTLSYARALYLEFFFDQTMENFLRGHAHAFQAWNGQPRTILYDNMRSVVLERRGNQILFHPCLLELSAHYHFAPQPCQVRAGNQKGRVERAIRYVRDSFWAARSFTTLAECNRQAWLWRDEVAHQRRWPGRMGAPSPKFSLRNSRGYCLRRCICSIQTVSKPFNRTRPSMCGLTLTTIPFRLKQLVVRSRPALPRSHSCFAASLV